MLDFYIGIKKKILERELRYGIMVNTSLDIYDGEHQFSYIQTNANVVENLNMLIILQSM